MKNVGLIHISCADQRKAEWQAAHPQPVIPGTFCKIRFAEGFGDDERSEHMWVKVTSYNGKEYIGILDNDPMLMQLVKCGDTIHFKHSEIEQTTI